MANRPFPDGIEEREPERPLYERVEALILAPRPGK